MTNLPIVPAHFVQQAIDIAEDAYLNWHAAPEKFPIHNAKDGYAYKIKTFINKQGKEVVGRNAPRFHMGKQWEQWVRDNIAKEFVDTGVSVSIMPDPSLDESSEQKVHTDLTRNFALLYLVDSSNPDQVTSWYQEIGKPIHRSRSTWADNMNELTEIDSVCIPKESWVYIDTRVLHRVDNVLGQRVLIMVSFDDDVFGIFKLTNEKEIENV